MSQIKIQAKPREIHQKLWVEVSLAFWKACYPDRKGPEYLNGLEYGKHLDIARKRIKLQEKIKDLNEIAVLKD